MSTKKVPAPQVIDGTEYKKANFLIGAKSTSSLLENKIMAVALSKIQEGKAAEINKNGSVVVNIPAAELKRYMGDKSGNIYMALDPIAKKMTGRVMGFSNPEEGTFDYISIISRAKYENSVLQITFNPEIKSFITNLNEKFTLLKLPMMTSFKSLYSFRIYELLRSAAYVNSRSAQMLMGGGYQVTFGLAELKFEIGVADIEDKGTMAYFTGGKMDYDEALKAATVKHYERWDRFKHSVLDTAVAEINEKTDLFISYQPLTSGRGGKTTSVEFNVYYKKDMEEFANAEEKAKEPVDVEAREVEVDVDSLIDEVLGFVEERITVKDVRALLKAAENDVERIRKAYAAFQAADRESIANPIGWLVAAIREGYEPAEKRKAKQKSTAPFADGYADNGHEYDFSEIELRMRNKAKEKQSRKQAQ